MEDKENKTEDATPKKLQDAKKKGQIAKSGDLNGASGFFIFTILITSLGNYLLQNSYTYMKLSIARTPSTDITERFLRNIFLDDLVSAIRMLLPFFAVAMVVGIIANLIQVGFIFTVEPLKPNIKKLNPIEGFKNMFSKKTFLTLIKNLMKLVLIFYLAYKTLSTEFVRILNTGNIGTEKLFPFFLEFIKDISIDIAIVMFLLGIMDYVLERQEWKKNLRMSKQDIKDEHKQMEGDPEIKGKRKQKQREISMGRMMQDMEDSTVVITNPTHLSVVLKYDSEKDKAPLVTAKGADHLAKKIREKAKEYKIPIIENKPLARTMYKDVDIGDTVPTELYQAIAEVLALVYDIERKNKGKI